MTYHFKCIYILRMLVNIFLTFKVSVSTICPLLYIYSYIFLGRVLP